MPRKGELAPWPELGPRDGAYGLTALCRSYLQHMSAKGLSHHTIKGHRNNLRRFLRWCADRDIASPTDIKLTHLESFQYFLGRRRKRNGHPLAQSQQRQILHTLRTMMRYAHKREWIKDNPAERLELPRVPRRLPMDSLGVADAEEVLRQPDIATPAGLRDRAMMELMYSSGLRRSEATYLKTVDIDFDRRVVRVRKGKGNKDRVVPVGTRALGWLGRYIREGRPHLAAHAETYLFVTDHHPGAVSPDGVSQRFGAYVRKAGKAGACHIFRHTMATLMLDGGADIRSIQEMLGHADLSSTQVYTHVSVGKLCRVHAATHPAAGEGTVDGSGEADRSDNKPDCDVGDTSI